MVWCQCFFFCVDGSFFRALFIRKDCLCSRVSPQVFKGFLFLFSFLSEEGKYLELKKIHIKSG